MKLALKQLEDCNQYLSVSNILSRKELIQLGIIKENLKPVYRVGTAVPQQLPFKRLMLPMAFTGILIPNKAVNENHKAIQILLPGTGSTFSVAETMCDLAGTFHGRKSKNRGKGRKSSNSLLNEILAQWNEAFNIASFPIDLPLNGMGSNAPFEFASKRGLLAMIRHTHLVLSHLYPDRPVFITGRSQGGIAAILYAQYYQDIAGVIASNPPHPDEELFQFTVDYLESKAQELAMLLHAPGVKIHKKSWEAYKTFTPNFDYPSKKSLAPTLILVSLDDPFNLFPRYEQKMRQFDKANSNSTLHIFNAGHNIWNRKNKECYKLVIELQTKFMFTQIKRVAEHVPIMF